jgi:hypothetical protein
MNKTRRTIGIAAVIGLVVLGTGWAVERSYVMSYSQGGVAAETAPVPDAPAVPTTDAYQEYDRSDLLLIQG